MHANGCGIPEKSWQFFFLLSDGFALTCKSKLIAKKIVCENYELIQNWKAGC